MKALVRKAPIRRAVFNPRNSTCGSASVEDLSASWWWTDNSDTDSLYIHACRCSDRTYHRVWPRRIQGYTCKRLEMKNRIHGGVLFWLYDANPDRQARPQSGRSLDGVVRFPDSEKQ